MNGPSLRIAHVDTERTWRGGQAQVFSLIKGLAARGHFNLSIVTRDGELSKKMKAAQRSVFEIGSLGEWDFITAHFVNRKLKEEKIDVVHAHSGHAVALAAISTLGTRIPVVVTRRVDFPLSKNIFSRWKYKRARRFIAISHKVKDVLIESGVPSDKITIVPSGIEFSKFENISKPTAGELGVPPDAVVVGQVAALAPHKDQVTFLKSIALLRNKKPNVHAVIVGEGELRHDLEKLASELNIRNAVHFLGFRPDPLLLLAGFDVFCLSSREEGLGTSLLDAMALGIPIVATRVGGIPEIIEHGVTGILCEARNPTALSEALFTALQAKDANKQMIANALIKCRNFDIEQTINGTETIYHELSTDLSPRSTS